MELNLSKLNLSQIKSDHPSMLRILSTAASTFPPVAFKASILTD